MNAEDLAGEMSLGAIGWKGQYAIQRLLPYANLLLQMREALRALSGQAKLARPSSLMVPLIDDAEETLLAASHLLGDE